MTTQRTLRRKLQKKLKHKPFRKCPKCGERMKLRLEQDIKTGVWHLFKRCCGIVEELHWTGKGTGGTVDTYRRQGNLLKVSKDTNQRKGESCAGSNPASSTGPVLIEHKFQ